MAKTIKLSMENFSTEASLSQAVSAINSALPAGGATPAQVIRDANGKIVQVIVALPSNITAQQHMAARDAALDKTPGVSSSTKLPAKADFGFDSLTPGDSVVSSQWTSPTGEILDAQLLAGTWTASQSVDAFGGSGSALKGVPDNGAGWGTHLDAYLFGNASTFGFSTISVWEYRWKMNIPANFTGDQFALIYIASRGGATGMQINAGGSWTLFGDYPSFQPMVAPPSGYLDCACGVDATGKWYVTVNGNTVVSLGSTVVDASPQIFLRFCTVGSAFAANGIFIDNLEVSVLAGQ